MIIPALLLYFWGGLVPPLAGNYDLPSGHPYHHPAFSLKNLTAILAITGFYLLPASLYFFRKIKKWSWLAIVLLSLFLPVFFKPEVSSHLSEGHITGLVSKIIHIGNKFFIGGDYILFFVCIASGLVGLQVLGEDKTDNFSFLMSVLIVFFLIMYCFDALISERHLIPLVITLYFAFARHDFHKKVPPIWAVTNFLIGTAYCYYWFFTQNE